ncbi:2-keto-3-deoxygluconate permease [Burkholderia gladioli]|uniref:2-keto-3-deoxygluconate permease n=1 Tax=Burkholderia gladioli TaxID=28095 RepID=UPI0015E70A60|nr:2-keto-3-deoxygluconate permease [Burkholderia gladioli]MBA1363119.1 hypothetical protein [Burkholderia gladioli]
MKIKRAIERFPGGMMVIPLLWGSVLNTFAPHVLAIGSFSTQLAHGALPILAVFFVCMGAEIQLRTAPRALRNGAAITLAKLASGVAIGFAVSRLCGPQGLFGLSGMAIIAAVTNANMGLYAAVTRQFGDEVDRGALAVLSILEGPFVTMVALGLSGLATIPVIDLVATVLPIVIGMVLGNLAVDPRLGSLVAMATPQIAASTIVTSLLAPLAAAAYARWHGRRRARDAELHEAASTSKA